MSSFVVRPVEPDAGDLVAIAEIMGHYVRHSVATFAEQSPTVPDWARRCRDLAEVELPFLVVETDGTVAGFAYAAPWRAKAAYRHTVEDSVYLAPTATGGGLGRALLAELVDRSARAGYAQMIAVIADTGDPASIELHRRLGFVDAGRLRAVGFKHGRWIDTVLMQRELAAPR